MAWDKKPDSVAEAVSAVVEPREVVVASEEATFIYAGKLDDGTQVVRDSSGLLHALVPVKKACDS